MTREEFFEAIQKAKIRPGSFDLNGQGDECYILSGSGNHWSVYYSERGLETKKHDFGSEADALAHLFDLLKNDHSTRL